MSKFKGGISIQSCTMLLVALPVTVLYQFF